tara:strand:+ start:324 stop:641 length:318 start_codon:yes stop_codon:yes gene_type:complete
MSLASSTRNDSEEEGEEVEGERESGKLNGSSDEDECSPYDQAMSSLFYTESVGDKKSQLSTFPFPSTPDVGDRRLSVESDEGGHVDRARLVSSAIRDALSLSKNQ